MSVVEKCALKSKPGLIYQTSEIIDIDSFKPTVYPSFPVVLVAWAMPTPLA
jgi:hypothetical protein